jgi:transcriptional regulator with XRE-family HTH domain
LVIQRIVTLLKEKELKKSDLCKYLGINNSTMANWQSRNTDPPSKYIIPICEFLDVSPYYLLTGEDSNKNNNFISPSDQEVLELLHQLPKDVQQEYKAEIRGYVKAVNKKISKKSLA